MPAVIVSARSHLLSSTQGSHPRPSAPRGVRNHEYIEHALYENNNIHTYLQSAFQRDFSFASHSLPPQPRSPSFPSRMLGYLPAPSSSSSWHQMHMNTQNVHPPPPPPSIAHKVWILDCRSCGIFLTNRGMKAVLLLRPNVSLFSTDALPINCSVYNRDTSRSFSQNASVSQGPPRTCECLTQNICCHGCGNTVGYMIVKPCSRCTSSITATNRATNGHRFVFHSSEITNTERCYVPDEPGVIPFKNPMQTPQPSSGIPNFSSPPGSNSQNSSHHLQSMAQTHIYMPPPPPSSPPPLVSAYDYLPPPPDMEQRSHHGASSGSYHSSNRWPAGSGHRGPPSVHPSTSHHHSAPSYPSSSFIPSEYSEQSPGRRLKAGEVLYWHQLSKNGEIPCVEDNRGGARYRASLRFDR